MQALPSPGSIITLRRERWRVDRVRRDRRITRLDVSGRHGRATFLLPFDRLEYASRTDRGRRLRPRQATRRLAATLGETTSLHGLDAAVGARIDIRPFQLEPALAMQGRSRRVLLADEVGLGKTIQAGLVIAERLRHDPDARVLVLAPASLRAQWQQELDGKFGLAAHLADARGLAAAAREHTFGENPWRRTGIWIASLDFLKQPHVLDTLPLLPWDLVVIDEAHDACGDSERYRASVRILHRARRTLLLTATPHSGDETRFTHLSSLGSPPAERRLLMFRRTRADAGLPRERVVRWCRVRMTAVEEAALQALDEFDSALRRASRGQNADPGDPALLSALLRKRALSSMTAFARTIARRTQWLDQDQSRSAPDWTQPGFDFEDEVGPEDRQALAADSGLPAAHERAWLGRLLTLARRAARHDSRLRRLTRLLSHTREPAIVFTEYRDSLDAMHQALTERGFACETLHGALTQPERDRALARFDSGECRLLLTTDVAGQGLNLHRRCRWVVNLEIPWNPARLEQRAGRVDRLGQTRRPHITMVVARNPGESGMLDRIAERIAVARHDLGSPVLDVVVPVTTDEDGREPRLAGKVVEIRRLESRQVKTTGRFRAPAATAAIDVERRRRWRGERGGRGGRGAAGQGGAAWSTGGSRLWAKLGSGLRLVYSVPILNARLDEIERHVLMVHVAAPASADGTRLPRISRELREACGRAAAARLAVRSRRLARRLESDAARGLAVDARIARICRAEAGAARWQPGLFDKRAERGISRRREAMARQPAEGDEASETQDGAVVSVGPARLVLAIGGRC